MKYRSEDITFCANRKCKIKSCDRNPKRIRGLGLHSFANLENTEFCKKKQNENILQQDVGKDGVNNHE